MKFTKMQGTGNDYIYVNCFAEDLPAEARPALAVRISDRHFGVGGDGLICICPSDIADFRMDMYNADGSVGLMCGNGIRCVGKYVYDRGLTDKTELQIETASGIKSIRINVENGIVDTVRVDMGSPEIAFVRRPVEAAGQTWEVTALSVGNPHAVIFIEENVDGLDLLRIGPAFAHHPLFPEGVNTEFVNVLSPDRLKMRVWERGSGETLACGTGATAAFAAANVCGLAGGSAAVELPGGKLLIEWDKAANKLYMTGPAVTVFEGEI
ncbi:MAG: diaminopimelate epimerase [Firmicutes bacterium]|nr:diaminopimelate epimerase [Bacillota bacterium]